jgi:hypothetical protein
MDGVLMPVLFDYGNPVHDAPAVMLPHPKYWSPRELLIIFNDPRFFELLEGPITEICVENGDYLFYTASHKMSVDVVRKASTMIGQMPTLELIFHNPERMNTDAQVLPPCYQIVHEIQAILSDNELFSKLGNEILQNIRKTPSGYAIRSRASEIQVDVHYIEPEDGKIDEPVRFYMEFHDPLFFFL